MQLTPRHRHWSSNSRRFGHSMRAVVHPARLQLAAKTAVTAAGAWWIGHFLPGEVADYAYYAPLGVLVTMTPTVAVSLQSSIKTLAGILFGLLISWSLILIGVGGVPALTVAVCVAMLVAAIPGLEPGGSYVPIAAAYVFLVGENQPSVFSLGFAAQFALGAALGIAVNLVLPPPLEVKTARRYVSDLRESVARCVELLADSLEDVENLEAASDWSSLLRQSHSQAENARVALGSARTSRRGNVRALMRSKRTDDIGRTLEVLRRMLRQLDEISVSYFDELPHTQRAAAGDEQVGVSVTVWSKLSEAGSEVATLIRRSGFGDQSLDTGEKERVLEQLSQAHYLVGEEPSGSLRDRERIYVFIYALRSILDELPEHPSE